MTALRKQIMARSESRGGVARPGRQHRCRRSGERGQAILVATIVLALIMGIIAATLFGTATDNITVVGHGVQQEQALRAARSGIDVAYQQIQAQTKVQYVPCGPTTPHTTTKSAVTGTINGNIVSTYKVRITYYSTPTFKAVLTCPKLRKHTVKNTHTVDPKAVLLISQGSEGAQVKYVKSLAHVAVAFTTTTTFVDGVYTDSLTMGGNAKITMTTKPVYLDQSGTCKGNAKTSSITAPLIYVQGSLTVQCTIFGSVWASKTITMSSNGLITGPPGDTVRSGGKITWKKGTITEPMYARGTITPMSTSPKTYATTTVTTPPVETFPPLTWTPGAWKAATYAIYTAVVTHTTCAKVTAQLDAMATATKPWAIHTLTCSLPGGVPLKQSLAFFTTANIKTSGPQFTAVPGHATPLYLYIVQPPAATPPYMKFAGGSGAQSPILTFLYTPGSVTMTGGGTFAQLEVYAKQSYKPFGDPKLTSTIPTPVHPGGGGGTPDGKANAGIVYLGETTPP